MEVPRRLTVSSEDRLGRTLLATGVGLSPSSVRRARFAEGRQHRHSVIRGHRQSRDEWIATIQKMIAEGAEGTEDQFTAVLEYVAKNFGPAAAHINVNQAPATELESGLGLSAKEAAAIVKYRSDKGSFKAVEDLKKVPDLDFKKIEAQKDRLVF